MLTTQPTNKMQRIEVLKADSAQFRIPFDVLYLGIHYTGHLLVKLTENSLLG
jgi:hypothetical protein